MAASMDRDFVKWVHRAAFVLLVVFVPLAGLYGKKPVLGYGLGGAISIGLLWSHQWLVARIFERGPQGLRRLLVGVWLLKYPVLLAILYLALTRQLVSPVALCLGLGLVPFAIAVKILGGALRGRTGPKREQ